MGLFNAINNQYNYLNRYKEIISVLLKYGFEDLVAYLETEKKFKFLQKLLPKKVITDATKLSRWEKMRLVCEELGPTYVKFGQIMSSRIDLLPQELITELEKLQDGVPPESSEVAIAIVEKELNGKINDLFASFDSKPFASASLSQVHKATLKTGEQVVLKIQRPNIEEKIKSDIKVMLYMAEIIMERVPSVKHIDPIGLIKNFETSILKELDFIRESINVQRFKNNFTQKETDRKYIHSPEVYQEFTTEKVLTLEFIDGVKISNFHKISELGLDRKVLARRLAVSYFKQVFEHGFFHADPHPGNLLAMKNNVLGYLDYGMMGNIMENDIKQFGALFTAVHSMEVKKIIRSLEELSSTTVIKNYRELESDLHEFVHSFSLETTHSNEISSILIELKDIVIKHNIAVPTHFFLLAKSMVSFEGVVKSLDPTLDLEKLVKPYLIKALSPNLNPLSIGKKVFNSAYEIGSYLEELPRDLKKAMRKINAGEIKVDLKHSGIDPFVHTLNRISKRIVQAILISGLIVGSSLLIVAKTPPFWKGTSTLGIIGLVIASLIGLFMLLDMSKGDHDDWKGWKDWNKK